jgi:hypothetical protein
LIIGRAALLRRLYFGAAQQRGPTTNLGLLQPEIPLSRNSFANASSVSLFPRERMRDITSERLALVKTSDTQRFSVISGQRETALYFVHRV